MSWQSTLATLQTRARTEQQQGELAKASATYEEALDVLHREEPGGTESVQAELALRTDFGNLLRQSKNIEAATAQFRAALSAIESIDAGPELELPRVGTTLQLASVLMDGGNAEAARSLVDSISDARIASLDDSQARAFMSVDVARLRGELEHARGNFGTASEHWATALRRAQALLEVHPPAAVMYARQFLERLLAVNPSVRNRAGWQDTLQIVQTVQAQLTNHVESGAEGADEQFVRIELLRAEVARRAGNMAEAEDAIWRAVEVDESWTTLMGALGIYTRLILEPDANLERGNLPREEVSGGASELTDRIMARASEVDEPEIFQTLLEVWRSWGRQEVSKPDGRNHLASVDGIEGKGAHVKALYGVLHSVFA